MAVGTLGVGGPKERPLNLSMNLVQGPERGRPHPDGSCAGKHQEKIEFLLNASITVGHFLLV